MLCIQLTCTWFTEKNIYIKNKKLSYLNPGLISVIVILCRVMYSKPGLIQIRLIRIFAKTG